MQEEFEDTKEVIRIRKSKKDRHHNDQMKKDKRTNNNLENTAQKPKYRATRTILKTGSENGFPGRVSSCRSTGDTLSCYSSYKYP